MARVASVVWGSYLDRAGRPTALLLFVVASAASMAAWILERGNLPYTLSFLTFDDEVIALVWITVPALGCIVVALRPRHSSGWLMLGAGVALAMYGLAHAVAVRLLLVAGGSHTLGALAAWLSTWLLIPGFGLLPFAMAAWPNGQIATRSLRLLSKVAAVGLALAAVAQAFAPEPIDGVARQTPIPNPLGIDGLAGPVIVVTISGVAVLVVFSIAAAVDVVVRALRARGERRRQLLPVALVVLLVPSLALTAMPLGQYGLWAAYAVAVSGTGVALVVAASGIRRTERAERARAALVAEREDERLRVRRELHDGVGPLLAALRLELDVPAGPEGTSRARALLDDAISEVRRISRNLRPTALDELGLLGALRQQADMLTAPGGPRMEIVASDSPPALPAAVEVAVLRISAEALTNVVRHARASQCRLELRVDGSVHLKVSDDGEGCTPAVEGLGLRSMKARAEELGGSCEVRSTSLGGTVVEAVLPLPAGAS